MSLSVCAVLSLLFSGFALAEPPKPDAWKQFVSALETRDQNSLRRHIRFPLESNLTAIPGWASIRTEAGFLAKFDDLRPAEAIDFLKRSSMEEVFSPENLEGSTGEPEWRLVWNDESGDPESETCLIYTFVVNKAGEVQIIAIDGAG